MWVTSAREFKFHDCEFYFRRVCMWYVCEKRGEGKFKTLDSRSLRCVMRHTWQESWSVRKETFHLNLVLMWCWLWLCQRIWTRREKESFEQIFALTVTSIQNLLDAIEKEKFVLHIHNGSLELYALICLVVLKKQAVASWYLKPDKMCRDNISTKFHIPFSPYFAMLNSSYTILHVTMHCKKKLRNNAE